MVDRLLAVLGGRWMTSDGQPLDADLTRHALYRLYSVLVALDLIQDDKATWAAGPSAQWLLPRATALPNCGRSGVHRDRRAGNARRR